MTAPVLAGPFGFLDTGPSVVQAVLVLAFVGLITAREVVRAQDPRPRSVASLDTAVRALAPVVLLVLVLRLVVIAL